MTDPGAGGGRRALLVDYAGVLTPGVAACWRGFEQRHDIPPRTIIELLWEAYEEEGHAANPVALLERGELGLDEFERELAGHLRDAGHDVPSDGLVAQLFADLRPQGGVWQLVRDVRATGVPCVLVSNSWGTDGYPGALLEETFDEVVISGAVGMRKPERRMFVHAVGLVDAELEQAVLVDDAPANVAAAESYGMTGVLHRGDDAATRSAVETAFGL